MPRTRKKDLQPARDAGATPWVQRNLEVMGLSFAWLDALLAEPGSTRAADAAAAYQAARAAMRENNAPAAIDRLSVLFGLSPFDEDVLILALSSQLRGTPKQTTPQLARSLLAGQSAEADAKLWERLGPRAPLRHFQLIECAERPLSSMSSLFVDERVGRYLMGEDAPDQRIVGLVTPVIAGPMPKRHVPGIERLAGRLGSGARPLAMIVGPKHSGRRAAATALARGFGLVLAEIKPRVLESAQELLPILAREAALGGFALLVDIDQPEAKRLFEERL
ncbi:MAG: hypothetical protein JNJ53_11895, partial [Rhizobiales bacterium]|nr:hypothetical protein [Hyphomicrobiales bacterium]